MVEGLDIWGGRTPLGGAASIPRVKQGKDFLLQSAARTNDPISEGYTKLSCFLGPGEWETLSLRGRSRRPGWMEGPDSRGRSWALASRVQGFPRKDRPRALGRVTLTSRPRPRSTGCDPRVGLARSPPDAPGCSWRLLGSPSDSPGSQASPSRPGQSAPPSPALACATTNESARHGPPPPGGGRRRGGGTVRPPRVGCVRGSRRRAARAGARGWGRGSLRVPSHV